MKINGRQLLQATVATTMAFTMLLAPLAAATASAAEGAKPGPIKSSSASTAGSSEQQASPQIQYQIQAKLDTGKMMITGKQTVTYRNTSTDGLSEIVFRLFADANRSKETQPQMFARSNEEIAKANPDKKSEDFLGGIDIISVKDAATGRALVTSNEKQALTVQLGKALATDEQVTLELEYKTKIPFGSQRLSYQEDIINGAHWFPVLSVYHEKTHSWEKAPYSTNFETDYYEVADYQVSLDVPDKLQLAMPGQVTEQPAGTGRKMVAAKADRTREFVFFASEKFQKASKTKNGLTIEYLYYNDRNDPAKTAVINKYIDRAFEALEFFGEKFGKYDYPEFRIVESHVQGVAVEFSRLIQMGLIGPDRNPATDSVFVHEIAHQWFHSIIGNNSETESFLDEGFADFAMCYFFESKGDKINGFDGIRSYAIPADLPINSVNDKAGDLWQLLFYKNGRLAIYELYRTVGEEKFDAFMKEYFKRNAYRNATVDGLLTTIEDQLGPEIRKRMDDNLNKPGFELKPEFQMTEAETAEFSRRTMLDMYSGIEEMNPDLPQETMFKIVAKALRGEPLTIVYSNSSSPKANAQQEQMIESLTAFLSTNGINANLLSERQAIKKAMKTSLGKSNIILVGNPRDNAFVQALKPTIAAKAGKTGFPWKEIMNMPGLHGAYAMIHPYNQNRLVVHYFWTSDHVNEQAAEQFITTAPIKTLMPTMNFYQFFAEKTDGSILKEKWIENPISKLFQTEE
ncbi:M1 family metallopeptidase [Paenibacillus thiaminolyticus]|uniref:M1 family metallopeptidase n=1 Tax=Paenibacillus thiaminolyticus TaxID=49283 RepID=UPI003D2680CD